MTSIVTPLLISKIVNINGHERTLIVKHSLIIIIWGMLQKTFFVVFTIDWYRFFLQGADIITRGQTEH
ncbi:hypothetical protein SAMN05660649_04495 [Desulfotomaculum arcticum]|uniref:Uncharacterized protein n=1 Tax=Desulfotruncus arcticus DSM 17038 TaxID=1121424 RepID=A0A1I2YMT2_9FIRM|nr:hypothetical protein SAMN05660649_04495 [Desulfotomaculum arcticum] [Desulfotruncus arcticus DSM 17038]